MKRPILILALIGVAAMGWVVSRNFRSPPPTALFEGYVEGDLVQIGPIEAERLATLNVEPGANVAKGCASGEFHSDELSRFPQLVMAPALVGMIWAVVFPLVGTVIRPLTMVVVGMDRSCPPPPVGTT